MSNATLTPEAKSLLAKTIRELRERLIRDLRASAEGAYRLALSASQAGLDEAHRMQRKRLEDWLDERVRSVKAKGAAEQKEARERFFQAAVKEAAATLLNRLVLVRHLEALGLLKPGVVTGGWNSKGYRELREYAPALLHDETEGYQWLLKVVFDELALDLPGLFGDVGTTRLFPVPAATLREVIEKLDDPRLESAWTDDTTLGWVYQYWNDPEREALDAKIAGGGKVEPHEIASKTQMFTERYMVEWLLHNSLGLMWLCMCKKHGWAAEAEAVLPVLDARRSGWRKKREAGEVALDALMPIEPGLEDRWKYYVPQPLPEDAIAKAPGSVRALKVLDPACGSGHFLVIAFDLLAALYEEEARHRGERWSKKEIAESILENNLHGVDIDPRAVQIAAAALFLKARTYAKESHPRRVNLVAPALNLGQLPESDPSLVRLKREIREETGIPEGLTQRLVTALSGVDHLGTLLKVDAAVEDAIKAYEAEFEPKNAQGDLFGGFKPQQAKLLSFSGGFEKAKATVLEKLEQFLGRHAGADELGLRLGGEQLAAGVRFVRLVKEGIYDVVVGNPPYQGTSKMAEARYVADKYPRGKADLYAVFLERGLELASLGGISALLTMRGWMFVKQYQDIREHLLKTCDLRSLGDVDRGAFDEVPNEVLAAVMSVFRKSTPSDVTSVAIQPTPLSDKSYDRERTRRKRAAVLAQIGRYEFDVRGFQAIEGEPIVYWWAPQFRERYSAARKLGSEAAVRKGLCTCDDIRYVRRIWEPSRSTVAYYRNNASFIISSITHAHWVPTIMGGKDRAWNEPLLHIVGWRSSGFEIKVHQEHDYGSISKHVRSADKYFVPGVAFTMIGNTFAARAHRYLSVFSNMGSSVFPSDIASTVCMMNSAASRFVLESLNPGVHFEVGDVNRLPIFPVENADQIYATLDRAFTEHEAARESSVEFKHPGPSPWTYAQAWAQTAVDRKPTAPLPPYEPVYEQPQPIDFVSYAAGVALGRFGANSEGLLDTAPPTSLPHGILFLSSATHRDGLAHPACAPLHAAWAIHGATVGAGDDLDTWLRKSFFDHHKAVYENRPIYFPLSSAKKNFVAWISIHRWADDTLRTLLADYLQPELRSLEGEITDLNKERSRAEKTGKARAEKRYADVQKLKQELDAFITLLTDIAEKGPPPTDDKCPKHEADSRFTMDLDDGVMVNSAALWPLLEPQWKDPKKWWKELATAQGRKDYDWAHLAARYFPARVAAKCKEDPSLAVAHHCFWRLHPEKAFAWELRLQDEIRPDFTIDEPDSDEHRRLFFQDHPDKVEELRAKERARRAKKAAKSADDDSEQAELFETEPADA